MSALIRQYLHDIPDEGFDEFVQQAAQALWLEERYFKNLSQFFRVK